MASMKSIFHGVQFWGDSLSQLIFPRLCFGCNESPVEPKEFFCMSCLSSLPYTRFEQMQDNPVEKLFWGRVKVAFATSTFYFQEETPIQQAIHQLKYGNQPDLGIFLGELMGIELSKRWQKNPIDALIPMPLHPKKENARGYNQAALLCKGISLATGIAVKEDVLQRVAHTATQTKKNRIERWDNVSTAFVTVQQEWLSGKKIMLVDDVITTGASTEACINTLLLGGIANASVCSLAFTF
jgi:ComF family protein